MMTKSLQVVHLIDIFWKSYSGRQGCIHLMHYSHYMPYSPFITYVYYIKCIPYFADSFSKRIGVKKISIKSFNHLHALDIYFHKISSKNTVFAINKAIRSIESVLRFTLGFFTPVAFEFLLLCGTL